MRKSMIITLVVVFAALFVGYAAYRVGADKKEDEEEGQSVELAKALQGTKVPLDTGLPASEREGQPISGKFELEEGKLQLSVYTMKGNAFSEVIVDHTTGKTAKVEPITSGEDLAAAKMQAQAMAQAKQSLRAVVDKAINANQGFRAVSVFPALKGGHSVADITLVKGEQFKTVSQPLD